MGAHAERKMLEAGQPAAGFSLRQLGGATVTLAEILRNGPALLAFFKVTCPTCQYAFPFIERVHQAAQDGKLQVFGISQDGPADTREFAAEFEVRFPMLLDEASQGYPASNAYNIAYVPSMFLVEPDGSVSHSWHGFSRPDMEALGRRVSAEVFRRGEKIPDWKAG